ncbi:MAG: metallophosphoesterase [Thermoplasmata archaeon]
MHVMNERAMFEDSHKYLIISDLHLGLERSLEEKGFKVPDQYDSLLNRIFELAEITDARGLIILGDIKHDIGIPKDLKKFQTFFKKLSEQLKIIIIKGNHDGAIEKILDTEIHSPRGILKWDMYLSHGHTWPSHSLNRAKYLLMGHIHPEIKLINEKTKKLFNSCWLKTKPGKNFKKYYSYFNGEIIIFPAFNPLVGMAIPSVIPGPIFNNKLINIKNLDVYLLDSTYLGKFGSLKNKSYIY